MMSLYAYECWASMAGCESNFNRDTPILVQPGAAHHEGAFQEIKYQCAATHTGNVQLANLWRG